MTLFHDASKRSQRGSHWQKTYAVAAVEVKTVKIGTRGSPLALAQAYMTRDKLKVRIVRRRVDLPVVLQAPSNCEEGSTAGL